jgi:hypothetical protein
MTQQLKAYVPGKRSYAALTKGLRVAWETIVPSVDGKLKYYPCSTTLKDGRTLPCVYVMDAQSYIDGWGVWPEDDKGKHHVRIEDVVSIAESPLRLPARMANELYRAGESGMGYCLFTLVFSDGSRQAYVSGNAVDFIHLPNGKTTADISAVLPHEGRNALQKQSPEYFWCLFGEGESGARSQRFAEQLWCSRPPRGAGC